MPMRWQEFRSRTIKRASGRRPLAWLRLETARRLKIDGAGDAWAGRVAAPAPTGHIGSEKAGKANFDARGGNECWGRGDL